MNRSLILNRSSVIASVAVIAAILSSASQAAAVDPAVLKAQQRRVEVIRKVAPAVVAIFGAAGGGGGSGVVISPDGYALTNYHVTRGAGDWMKCGLGDGRLYDAVIVGVDPTGDVALIRLLGRDDFPHATLGDSDKLQVGEWVYAMGNPFLLATDFQPTVTYGIVSGLHRYQYPAGTILEYTDCIQIDSSINPGNSGGPLFNGDGEIVGINGRGSFEKRGRVNSGAGYAISINQIRNFMGHLKSGRIVDHATLGALVATRDDGAVVVTDLMEESEAGRRGLQIGDEIVSFAGRPIRSVNQFKNILGIYPRGWKLPLVYRREGLRREIFVRLRALHRKSELQSAKKPRPKPKLPPGKPGDKPRPVPLPSRPPAAKPPEKYKHMYVQKQGYANYYFNQLERDRVLQALKPLGEFPPADAVWTLSGRDGEGGLFKLVLGPKQVTLDWKDKQHAQSLENGEFADVPAGSGGLLIAMHNLKLLLAQAGEDDRAAAGRFTDLYYLGTEPLDGREPMVDVLVSELINAKTGARVECRWYFGSGDGAFKGFDTFLAEDADACQVRFGGWKDIDGRKFPTELAVHHGEQKVAVFRMDGAVLHATESRPNN